MILGVPKIIRNPTFPTWVPQWEGYGPVSTRVTLWLLERKIMILSVLGRSQTALEGSDRSHMATGPITHVYYKLGASVYHPDNLCRENSDFLVVEVTYNHFLYNGVVHNVI